MTYPRPAQSGYSDGAHFVSLVEPDGLSREEGYDLEVIFHLENGEEEPFVLTADEARVLAQLLTDWQEL